jgi:tRNA(fMet)-specific endonuclease VapC
MSGKVLLDTNIVILLFSEDDVIKKYVAQADEVFLPNTVVGELYFGAFNSSKKGNNITKVDELLIKSTVLSSDAVTAKEYGHIKSNLRKKGRPIPENDIWIAAIALQYGLKLISRDSHFKYIDNLDLELL